MGMVVGSLCSCPVSLPSRAHCETLDWTLEHRLGHWSLWSVVGMAGKKVFSKTYLRRSVAAKNLGMHFGAAKQLEITFCINLTLFKFF